MFTEAFPILTTPDVDRALAFYVGLLGARETYRFPDDGPPGYVSVTLGSTSLGIGLDPEASQEPGQRIALWVYAESCDRAIEGLQTAGVTVLEPPQDQQWGERVARVLDPDGNEVIVGERPAAATP